MKHFCYYYRLEYFHLLETAFNINFLSLPLSFPHNPSAEELLSPSRFLSLSLSFPSLNLNFTINVWPLFSFSYYYCLHFCFSKTVFSSRYLVYDSLICLLRDFPSSSLSLSLFTFYSIIVLSSLCLSIQIITISLLQFLTEASRTLKAIKQFKLPTKITLNTMIVLELFSSYGIKSEQYYKIITHEIKDQDIRIGI